MHIYGRLLSAGYSWSSNAILRKPTVASVKTHTMGGSLLKYLQMKVHPDIQDRTWSGIFVRGEHLRSPPARLSMIEKKDKPFNWQRPTTKLTNPDMLELLCFPGLDYIQHYSAIIATYLSLIGKCPDIVSYRLPSFEKCMGPLLRSNLGRMGPVDIVVVGYVQGLHRFTRGSWKGGGDNELFAWQKMHGPNGRQIAFLGCRVSFWGDIGGNMIRALQTLTDVKCVLYVGKLGSLRAEHVPNQWLATGCQSFLGGHEIRWENVLEPFVRGSPRVVHGNHFTLPSVLDETHTWLEEHKTKYDLVDPEIGHMAKASVDGGTHFGYLHIISDNLARKYTHDLSNERIKAVLQGRNQLVGDIQDILERFFRNWSPSS